MPRYRVLERNFYRILSARAIRAIARENYAPAYEPLVSGKSIEHVGGRRWSAFGDFFRLAGAQSRM